ncbi:Cyclic nucleotide-gated potassium channel [Tsuneonella dongtanensis]|uniref:Cyclic nucleotide-gated potassium channel n=1 Tax=Tsuneonella dongtanensis TaxID=692370 RepID=A0A1B2A8T5_9SPHN|nr:ion transporter [Tsuneonella dongtanensis]ANY18542.1 Cyclic nucleotide-gated potassium channel [Tsuneonella dongtanensis]
MARLRRYLHHQLTVGAELDGHLTWMNRLLVAVIIVAVATAVLSTEPSLGARWHRDLVIAELVFGTIFVLEYAARIFAAAEEPGPESAWRKRWHFIRSPLGLIDLVVIASTLLPLITADVAVLRMVRLVRVIAVMKFGRFSAALREIGAAIGERKDDLIVTVALAALLLLFGATALFVVEGTVQPEAFGSIPRALWWSVNTFTTVGYGDVVPVTALGKVFAALVALGGVAFVAMPTGIIAAAFSDAMQRRRDRMIEEMRAHLARLDRIDEEVEAKIAALERAGGRRPTGKP